MSSNIDDSIHAPFFYVQERKLEARLGGKMGVAGTGQQVQL